MGRFFYQHVFLFILVSLTLCLGACQSRNIVLEQVKNELCDKQVVLLGESGFHGDGATEQFKADLIPKLVEDCGFNLVLFESSFYEFANINRMLDQGKSIEPNNIATAIGGLWKDDQEIQGLIIFLTDKANAGVLRVAGIDDQLGGIGQDYANSQMPKEISQGLGSSVADYCQKLLERRIGQNFPENAPYSQELKEQLLRCYGANRGFGTRQDGRYINLLDADERYIKNLILNLRRYIDRDFDRENYFDDRARSMFQNFEFLHDQYSNSPKTIIWTATVHAAKARGHLKGRPNMGTYIHSRFGDQAFVLGFSALGGQYRKIRGKVFDVPNAPKDSIEFQTMAKTEDEQMFLTHKDLEAFGRASASIYSYKYEIDNWSAILDGLVIFREQRPTTIIED